MFVDDAVDAHIPDVAPGEGRRCLGRRARLDDTGDIEHLARRRPVRAADAQGNHTVPDVHDMTTHEKAVLHALGERGPEGGRRGKGDQHGEKKARGSHG